MKRNQRLMILGGLLLLVSGAALKLSHGEMAASGISEPVQRSAPVATGTGDVALLAPVAIAQQRMVRLDMSVSEIDPFASRSWYIPPPPPPPQALPAPVAPPLPFVYVGRFEEDKDNWTIFLRKGTASFAVRKDDVFDSNYRFDGLVNGNLLIQYLPLKMIQTLAIDLAP